LRPADDVRRILLAERKPDKRLRLFGALLSGESGLGISGLTIVGGSAIELYTGGAYVSGDIDVIVSDRKPVEQVLRSWGFKDEGKLWTNDELGLFVDLMQRDLTGSSTLTRVIETSYGPLRLGAIEDLILKRVLEARYWAQKNALAQAILLVTRYGRELDWEYIDFKAKREQIQDLVQELRKRGLRSRKK